MDRPDIDEAAVVDVGQKDGHQDADGRCTRLHHGPAVVADAGDLAGELIHGKAAACFAAHDDSASTAIALLNRQSSRYILSVRFQYR